MITVTMTLMLFKQEIKMSNKIKLVLLGIVGFVLLVGAVHVFGANDEFGNKTIKTVIR